MRSLQIPKYSTRSQHCCCLALLAGIAAGCVASPATRPQAFSLGTGSKSTSAEVAAAMPAIQSVAYNSGVVVPAAQPKLENQDATSASGTPASRVDGDTTALGDQSSGNAPPAGEAQPTEAETTATQPSAVNSAAALGTQQPVDYFVSIALQGHPQIRAARQRVAAATNVAPQVRSLPDPMFNNIIWPSEKDDLQTAGGRVSHQFNLTQGVPWPQKLQTKAAIADREVQMAQAELARIQREVVESVRLAYYEVWFATRAVAINHENRELVRTLTQVAEARYRSGGSQQDVLRAQLESDRLDDQLVALTQQKLQAQADLAALVQQPVTLIPEAVEDLNLVDVPQRLDGLLVLAEECSPELRMLAWEIQRDRQRQRLARLQKYPDLQLGLNYSIITDDDSALSPVADGQDNFNFTVGTTLPIWYNRINAGMREASHRTSSTVERLEAERNSIQGRLRRLMAQADALVQQQEIYNSRIIPRTEDTLKLAIADYRGERTDFFSLIETYRDLLAFETQLARFEASLASTVAQIERTVGCPTN